MMQHPATIPPAPAVMAILDRFNRDELGHTIEVLIALLDIWDGDPESENATDLEDDHTLSGLALQNADCGPGCSVADQDAGAYVEWHTVPANLKRNGQPCILAGQEDDEDDDPKEDDNSDAEHDGREPEDGV
jgi:hypothetical protein